MVKSRVSERKGNRATNNIVVINPQFSMRKLNCGKGNTAYKFEKWLDNAGLAVSSLFPAHTFVTLNNEKYSYKEVIKAHKPKLPTNYAALSPQRQIEAKSEFDQMMKSHVAYTRDLEKDKPAVFALILSLLSKESVSRVKQHQRWSKACSYENNHFDPAILMNIIKVTHQNGMLAIDEDIRDVKREFKYTFYNTKQTKNETLFDWIERIIALQDRDKAICTSDPDYDPAADHVPIIPEDDYAALTIDRLNEEHSDIRADYINQKRLKNWKSFKTVQEAREFIDSYEHSKQLIDQRDEAVSRSEFTTLKTTLQSVLNGNSEEAKVLLSKGTTPKKKKKSSSGTSFRSTGSTKPSRPCKHCENLKVSTDRMHWDKDCPIAAYIAANGKGGSDGADGRDHKTKAGSKKRKSNGKRKTDKVDDDDNDDASEDDDSDDNDIDHSFDERKAKKSKRGG